MFLKLEKKYMDLPNGEKIAYIEKGQGDKVILLIHGNFSSCYHYEPLYKRIPDDYRVIVPDLRGYGDSSYNTPIDTLHELADDVVLLLKALGIEKAVVTGWSLGGCVSMSMAARYPEMVEKLILISSGSAKGYPVFSVGDYNAEPDSEPMMILVQSGELLNSYETTQTPPYGTSGTFHNYKHQGPFERRIDHILHSAGISVLKYATLNETPGGRFPSDHYPVMVEVEFQ
jgi:pimeloyl-ACP methyl ester carboxylesterase